MTEEKVRVPCIAVFPTGNLSRNSTMLHLSFPGSHMNRFLYLVKGYEKEYVLGSGMRRHVIESRILCLKLIHWIASDVLELTTSFIQNFT